MAWTPTSPELTRLDPVRTTKATDAVLTMAATVIMPKFSA